jgi:hypothetical protein
MMEIETLKMWVLNSQREGATIIDYEMDCFLGTVILTAKDPLGVIVGTLKLDCQNQTREV